MNCRKCGHENREGARFCGECAASLAPDIPCSACGTINPTGQKFCDECGASLGEAVDSRPPRVKGPNQSSSPAHLTTSTFTANTLPLSPRSYTPNHLADKILQSKSALEGERKQVTVLFADAGTGKSRLCLEFVER
ncbi:MAG: zinc-ribbon domain-containing protein, partial [Candidatus Binatia bacterium]